MDIAKQIEAEAAMVAVYARVHISTVPSLDTTAQCLYKILSDVALAVDHSDMQPSSPEYPANGHHCLNCQNVHHFAG